MQLLLTSRIVVLVIAMTCQPGHSSSAIVFLLWANFLHQTCNAALINHLSSYTGLIPECCLLFITGDFPRQHHHI